jgi:hypothetical protein
MRGAHAVTVDPKDPKQDDDDMVWDPVGDGKTAGVLGTAASHGCIRLDTQAITWLATRIEPGVPVTITR